MKRQYENDHGEDNFDTAAPVQPTDDSDAAGMYRRTEQHSWEDDKTGQMTRPVRVARGQEHGETDPQASAGNATEDILAERLARVLQETRKHSQAETYHGRQLGGERQTTGGYPADEMPQQKRMPTPNGKSRTQGADTTGKSPRANTTGTAPRMNTTDPVPRVNTTGKIPYANTAKTASRAYSAASRRDEAYSSPENRYRRLPPVDPRSEYDEDDDDSVFGKKLKQQYESEDSEEKRGRGPKKIILIVVIVVLAVAAALVAFKLIPDDNQGFPGKIKRSIMSLIGKSVSRDGEGTDSQAIAFSLSGYGTDSDRASAQFSVTTAKGVNDIRLTDENGVPLEGDINKLENAEEIIWKVTLYLKDGYKGRVSLQIKSGDGEWEKAENAQDIEIEMPTAMPKATASETPEKTEIPSASVSSTPVPTVDMTNLEKVSDNKVQIVPVQSGGTDSEKLPEEEPVYHEPEDDTQEGSEPEPPDETFDGGDEETADETTEEAYNEQTEEPIYPGDRETEQAQSIQTQTAGVTKGQQKENDPAATKHPAAMFFDEEDEPGYSQNSEDSSKNMEKENENAAQQTEDTAPDQSAAQLFPKLEAQAAEGAEPSVLTSSVYEENKKLSEYNRPADKIIQMPKVGQYTKTPMGVLTFRNDAFRQNAASGTVESADNLTQAWAVDAGSAKGADKTYYGIGWTGQPVIVKWSKEVREKSNMKEEKLAKSGLKEVIIAGLDGTIYFLDLSDGSQTRPPIKLGYPMKGTPSLHPNGSPLLTVGQYARKMKSGTGKIGLRTYNLYDQKEMKLIDGLDGKLRRGSNQVGSFETSALIDRTTDTLVTAGTNGLLYVINLNSAFDYKNGTYSMSPTMIVAKSKIAKEKDQQTAVEASVAMYDHYVFYADMAGVLRCVDTTTMQPVWAVNTGDSVESTIALDFNDADGLNLYTANILNNRKSGNVTVRCYDAMTGAEKWHKEIAVKKDTSAAKAVVGFRASPVIGQDGLQELVFYTVTGLTEEGCNSINADSNSVSALIALDKNTGEIKWSFGMPERTESSPVAVYDAEGNGKLIQCCSNGDIYLIDGLSGKKVSSLHVEGVIDASPAVYNDMMVIGTTGKDASHIYGIQIN